MPPKTTGPTIADLQRLMATVEGLQKVVEDQQKVIEELKSSGQVSQQAPAQNPLQGLKAHPIPVFSGKASECNSVKVKSFICSVRRVGELTNSVSEEKLVQLAKCHLQDRAAMWISRLESAGAASTSLLSLQDSMMKDFVPANEKTRAVAKLWSLKMSSSMEKHITEFIDLIDLACVDEKQAYKYFFNSLPGKYKKEFIRTLPNGEFEGIAQVYDLARKLDFSDEFDSEVPNTRKVGKNGNRQDTGSSSRNTGGQKKNTTRKDLKNPNWEPTKSGEGHLYRQHYGCCKCKKGPWSDVNHPCRKLSGVDEMKSRGLEKKE